MERNNIVFVYGTLKNMHQHFGRGKLLGVATTDNKYLMFDGGFPLVTPVDDVAQFLPPEHDYNLDVHLGQVRGQVYYVSDDEVRSLDNYEGTNDDNDENGFYFRRQIDVTVTGDDHEEPSKLKAWIYFGGTAREGIRSREIMTPDAGVLSWVW